MKKILYIIPVICSLLFVGQVKAETIEYNYSISSYNVSKDFESFNLYLTQNKNIISQLYELLFEKYNSSYKQSYPYYILQIQSSDSHLSLNLVVFNQLIYFKPTTSYGEMYTSDEDNILVDALYSGLKSITVKYDFEKQKYYLPVEVEVGDAIIPSHYTFQPGSFIESMTLESNFDIVVNLENNTDKVVINNYRNTGKQYVINSGDIFPVLYKTNGLIDSFSDYIEVNLNDYSYVALSLKDYSQDPFSVDFRVKGQFCATPVYNYGMSSKDSVINNKVEDRCSLYYDDFTLFRFYILGSDLKNNSIYYLKSYDTTKENVVKIDTKVFDITYITEENKDNPYVNVSGKVYPTIPYDKLPSTATKNEKENYVPGSSGNFFDGMINSLSDIFTKPLEFLQGIWDSITSVFSLVTELFSLLPEPIPTFLIASFTLAIILGLLKIIL